MDTFLARFYVLEYRGTEAFLLLAFTRPAVRGGSFGFWTGHRFFLWICIFCRILRLHSHAQKPGLRERKRNEVNYGVADMLESEGGEYDWKAKIHIRMVDMFGALITAQMLDF